MARIRLHTLIKILLPLIWVGLVTLTVFAQPFPKRLKLPKNFSHAAPADLSAQLARRVNETYRRAMQKQNHYELGLVWTAPSRRYQRQAMVVGADGSMHMIRSSGLALADFLPTDVYPHASFLKKENLPDYFLAKHNLEIRKWLPILDRQEKEFARRINEFYAVKETLTHPAEQDMAWLAGQITDQHRYLLVGEEHEQPCVQREVVKLMGELGKSGRKVLLFTEFLYEGEPWKGYQITKHLPQYLPVWQAAQQAGIEVVGLEPEFVMGINNTRFVFPHNLSGEIAKFPTDIWTSVEGVRIRNAHWLNTLNRYRELYPQALFIIYAGGGHLEYGGPYSLGDVFAGPQTLVVNINRKSKNWAFGDLPDRVLKFNDVELSRLVGFDISFELSPTDK